MIEKEIWKTIEGFESNYEVSNFGRIRSLKDRYKRSRIQILKNRLDKDGYEIVHLHANNRSVTRPVHRLVALSFIPNYYNLATVNHKDEDKRNNHVSNLEWMSAIDNNMYGTRNKRASISHRKRAKPVFQYSKEGVLIREYSSPAEASDITGIRRSNILSCLNELTSNGIHVRRTAGGYKWSYNKNIKKCIIRNQN